MSLITRTEIETLIAPHEAPCITITMPTRRRGSDVLENPIRLKNLLEQAEERLVGAGYRAPVVRSLLEPARNLMEQNAFWQRQSDGLLLYLSPDLFRFYRLPAVLDDAVVVSKGFYIKPLFPLLAHDQRFFVLTLSQDAIRLYQGTRFTLAPVALRDVPQSLEEALLYEEPHEYLHWHTGQRAGAMTPRHGARMGRGTMHEGVFHGIGYGTERDTKEEMLRYFHQIDDGLNGILGDEVAPLVLAGVGYVLPIYRQANSLPTLINEGIEGSPKMLEPRDLHARAWAILEPRFRATEERARDQFESLLGRDDRRALTDPAQALVAAHGARVHALFVPRDQHVWGHFDPESLTARVDTADDGSIDRQDLLDLAVAYTYLNKGEVHVVDAGDVPGGEVLAAILRY